MIGERPESYTKLIINIETIIRTKPGSLYKPKFLQIIKELEHLVGYLPPKDFDLYAHYPIQYIDHLMADITNKEFEANFDVLVNIVNEISETLYQYVKGLTNMVGYLNVANKISLKPQVNVECSITNHGFRNIKQPFYECKTCAKFKNFIYCQACISSCHKNHIISALGELQGFCDCAFLPESDCLCQKRCTYAFTGTTHTWQLGYFCNTCGINQHNNGALCKFCIENCHVGHDVVKQGYNKCFCDCSIITKKCKSKV